MLAVGRIVRHTAAVLICSAFGSDSEFQPRNCIRIRRSRPLAKWFEERLGGVGRVPMLHDETRHCVSFSKPPRGRGWDLNAEFVAPLGPFTRPRGLLYTPLVCMRVWQHWLSWMCGAFPAMYAACSDKVSLSEHGTRRVSPNLKDLRCIVLRAVASFHFAQRRTHTHSRCVFCFCIHGSERGWWGKITS